MSDGTTADEAATLAHEPPPAGATSPQASTQPLGRAASWLALAHPNLVPLAIGPALAAPLALLALGRPISWLLMLLGALAVACVQAGAALLYEYAAWQRQQAAWEPLHTDVLPARTPLTAAGIYPLDALRGGVLALAVGAVAGVPLALAGGWVVVALGVLGLAAACCYSLTRFALGRSPVGDVVLALCLGPALVAVATLAQRQPLTPGLLALGLSFGLFALALAQLAHLWRQREDGLAGHRTATVLFGSGVSRALAVGAVIAAFALLAYFALPLGAPHLALFAFAALPAATVALHGAYVARASDARALAAHQMLDAATLFAFWLLVGLALHPLATRVLLPLVSALLGG